MNQYNASIARTENMSGFDSEFDEGGSFFEGMDDDNYMGMDGGDDSYASGGAATRYADPYIISVENTGSVSRTFTLFGFSQTYGQTNFGNNADLVITNILNPTAGYTQLYIQSQTKPFQIGKWRFQSTNATMLQQTLNLYVTDANGYTQSKPLPLSQLVDAYQQLSSILESKRVVTVDANFYGQILIPAGATLTITMYPTAIFSAKSKVLTGSDVNRTVAPRTSAKNTPVTVINTTQDVKSLGR